jgi:D-lactate dehydrogenase
MPSSVVFLEVDAEDTQRIRTAFPESIIHSEVLSEDALVDACKDAAVVSCFIYTQFTREVLQRLPKLKLLCTRSVGYNHVHMPTCEEQGITVCNVPDYGSFVIAEHVFALLLSTLRHIPEADARVQSGVFDYHGLRGMSLNGKVMGIVGTGRIGAVVACIAHGFGMHVVAVDRCRNIEIIEQCNVEYVDLDTLLSRSDVLTLHLPATPQTNHLLNAAAFEKMKDGVVIVNTARGELIDSAALLSALQSGKVRYALLDVLEHERNFQENEALITHPNAITTPHIAFYAEESMRNMYEDCFTSIREWKAGQEPMHVVRPSTIICDLPGVSRAK